VTAAVPRTGREVREVLRSLGAHPSRRLGQNFLVDRGVLDRIAAAAGAAPGDLVLEIGAGLGALTERLAAGGARVLAVEIDGLLAGFLREAFAGDPRVRLLEGDALDGRGGLSTDLLAALAEEEGAVRGGRFLVAANLPYSAGTPAILALLLREPPPADMVLMVQREVADRIRAAPSTPEYGPLSVLVQSVARTAPVAAASGRCFHPVPAVGSSVVRVTPDPALRAAAGDLARLRTVVHAAFGLRRKTLGNALGRAGLLPAGGLAAAGFDPGRRGESLSPAEFLRLAAAIGSLASAGGGGEDPGE
jgi:16S rRNA (adenine1518-N6/adenine1519-N6)-dimethyltransferase